MFPCCENRKNRKSFNFSIWDFSGNVFKEFKRSIHRTHEAVIFVHYERFKKGNDNNILSLF